MNKNKILKLQILHLVFFVAVLILSYSFAVQRVAVCDYVSINGDFQSFNVFRRILDGQRPYTDFSNYIGMAPIFINLPFLLLESSFAHSLFVTTFTTSVLFTLAIYILSNLITKSITFSCLIAVFIPKFIDAQVLMFLLGPKLGSEITQRFQGLYTPSNSMRGARSFLPILLIILFTLFCYFYNKKSKTKFLLIDKMSEYKPIGIIGAVLGFFLVWSNDFGIACIIAAFIILVSLQIFKYKLKALHFLKLSLLYFISVAVGLLISATIITRGNPAKWFEATVQAAEYQFFYFNGTQGQAILPYIFSNGVLWAYTGVMLCFLTYYLWKLIKGKATDDTVLLVFIALSMLGATFVYICGGSGYNFKEALEVYTILFVCFYGVKGVLLLLKKQESLVNLSLFSALALLTLYLFYTQTTTPVQTKGDVYPKLGGTSTFTRALSGAKEYIGEEKIFSMYATGLEVVTDQFQPTGYDYIIHALGSKAQKKYVEQFLQGSYKYVQTPSMDVGIWIANQNWYFYRHLLSSYEKDYQTEYSFIWKKSEIPTIKANVTLEIVQTSPSEIEIICTSDNKDQFVADVLIDYSTSFNSPVNYMLALGRKSVFVSTNCSADSGSFSGVALPEASQEYIPILMENGQGKAIITAAYGEGIDVEIKNAKYIQALPSFKLGE